MREAKKTYSLGQLQAENTMSLALGGIFVGRFQRSDSQYHPSFNFCTTSQMEKISKGVYKNAYAWKQFVEHYQGRNWHSKSRGDGDINIFESQIQNKKNVTIIIENWGGFFTKMTITRKIEIGNSVFLSIQPIPDLLCILTTFKK